MAVVLKAQFRERTWLQEMISRRNYFTITIVMLVVFFLFQFSNVALESWNHYEENSYIIDTADIPNRSDSYSTDGAVGTEGFINDQRETIVYIGDEDGKTGETISLWTTYTKRAIQRYGSLERYELAGKRSGAVVPSMIIIESDHVNWRRTENCSLLEKYAESGIHLVFCGLPDAAVIEENVRLQELFGIQKVREESINVPEIHLQEGFLLGGEIIYSEDGLEEGMSFTIPWYVLSSDAEIYMNGIPEREIIESEKLEDEDLPAIIWCKDTETAKVFVVSGEYMEDVAGLGLLPAFSSKMDSYEIYPVVNAQNMIYANYPSVADENREIVMERYSQPLEGLFQNVIWPDLVADRRESGLTISCMFAPQFDYGDDNEPDIFQFQRYMKLLNEQGAETGLSTTCLSDTTVKNKIARDHQFMQEALPDYYFTSLYKADLTEEEILEALEERMMVSVRTVVEGCNDNKEVIGYLSEYITRQSAVIDGFDDSVRHDFRVRCLETALGYTSVMVDMKDIVYPGEDGIDWVEASHRLRQSIQDYHLGEQGFDNTTVSECDERIRGFLALDYMDQRNFNQIQLERKDTGMPAWFVLRTDGETVESIEGGSLQQLEDNVYLIEMEENSALITLKSVY